MAITPAPTFVYMLECVASAGAAMVHRAADGIDYDSVERNLSVYLDYVRLMRYK